MLSEEQSRPRRMGGRPWAATRRATPAAGTTGRKRRAGLYLPADAAEDLSVALDAAGISRYEVNHRGSGQIDEVHYVGTEFGIYPLIAGIAATRMAGLGDEKKARMAAGGVGARWKQDPRTGRNTSQVAFLGYLQVAWDNGYQGLVRIQASGYQSDALLAALVMHCKTVAAFGRGAGHTISPVQLLCSLGAGDPRTVGQGERSTTITPIRYIPGDATEAPAELLEQASSDWPSVLTWALEYGGGAQFVSVPAAPPQPEPLVDESVAFALEGLQ